MGLSSTSYSWLFLCVPSYIIVHDGADLKNKLMGVMIYFNLQRKYTSKSCAQYVERKLYLFSFQSYKQYYEFVVSHSYILEQLVFAAPWERVHLCIAHGIDWPSLPRGVAMLPSAHSLGLLWLLGLACPNFYYWSARSSGSHKSYLQVLQQLSHEA
jgi:hypothetical protein